MKNDLLEAAESFEIRVLGLRKKALEENLNVVVSSPVRNGDAFSCHIHVEGLLESEIYGESPLSALTNALLVLDGVVNPPSIDLLEVVDVEDGEFPKIKISVWKA